MVMVQEYADGGDLFALLHKYGGRLSERIAVQMVLDPFLRVLQVSPHPAVQPSYHSLQQWAHDAWGRCSAQHQASSVYS